MGISETENFGHDNPSQELQPQSPPLPSPTQEPRSPLQQELTFPPLSRQDLLLSSLTLDEIRCNSGRSFGSINVDEFMANVFTENHQLEFAQNQAAIMADQPAMPQQASMSVPPPVCKKTVDEIWAEIHKFQPVQQIDDLCKNETLEQQQTLGQMTLEDFLVKAGVVQESTFSIKPASSLPLEPAKPFQNQNSNIGNSGPLEASYGLMSGIGTGFSRQQNVENCVSGNRFAVATYQMFSQSKGLEMREDNRASGSGATEICQNLAESSTGVGGKRRIIDGPPEVVVERRQRRMLKNRESAARSRARRQAYTVELEAELSQLKQENHQLTQTLADAEQTRKKEVAQRKHSTNSQRMKDKFSAIRRATSAPW